jgi:hypothetical protein
MSCVAISIRSRGRPGKHPVQRETDAVLVRSGHGDLRVVHLQPSLRHGLPVPAVAEHRRVDARSVADVADPPVPMAGQVGHTLSANRCRLLEDLAAGGTAERAVVS